MAKQSAARATPVRGQDPSISDIGRGVVADVTSSEDQKRVEGTDASQQEGVGEHDYSPAASAMQQPGGTVLSTYAGGAAVPEHGNVVGERQPLVVGQAPDAPNTPMKGSPNFGHKFHPDVPNPKNQSPVVRGDGRDPRNDPSQPGHDQADRAHPDYGKPMSQHVGRRADVPSYADLRRKAEADAEPVKVEPEPAE